MPFPPPGNLPDPEIKTTSPVFPALAGGFFTTEPLEKPSRENSIVQMIFQLMFVESNLNFIYSDFSFLSQATLFKS